MKALHKKLEDEFDEVKNETVKVRKYMANMEAETKERMTRMEERLEKLENKGEKIKKQKRKRDDHENENAEKISHFQPAGISYSDKFKNGPLPITNREPVYKSTWAK